MKIAVTGGRDNAGAFFEQLVVKALGTLHKENPISLLIEGGARGIDKICRNVALANGIEVATFEAQWDRYGKGAGRIRNRQMLEEGNPDLVVAFPGNRGTRDMVQQSVAKGVRVLRVGMDGKISEVTSRTLTFRSPGG